MPAYQIEIELEDSVVGDVDVRSWVISQMSPYMICYMCGWLEHLSVLCADLDTELLGGGLELIEAHALQESVADIERSNFETHLLANRKNDALAQPGCG